MKHLTPVLPLFALLGVAFVASSAPVFAQSLGQNRLRVELIDVNNHDQQEFFGSDEVFAQWIFSTMRNTTQANTLSRADVHFDDTRPISIKKGELKTFAIPAVVFDGVLPVNARLSGRLRVMEEDETRKWDALSRETRNNSLRANFEKYKRNREKAPSADTNPFTSADMESWLRSDWNSYQRPVPNPLVDLDDEIASFPLEIPVGGSPQEEILWSARGDGAVYTLHYRITRPPIFAPRPAPVIPLSTWQGDWQTTNGRVNLVLENGVLRGQLFLAMTDGSDEEWDHLELRAGSAPGQLVGTAKTGTLVTQVTLTLASDGQSFTATGQVPNQAAYKWSGKRNRVVAKTDAAPATSPVTETFRTQNEAPTPDPLPVVPATPTVPAPATSTGNSGAFLPLRSFEVRLDQVRPNVAGDKLEVLCTFKNRAERAENLNGSMISAVATDSDGVGYLSHTAFYRTESDAQLMAGNREVSAQGELKARILIPVPEGTAPLQTLTLWETSSQPQNVDISGVQWPGARPAANLAALKLSGATPEFQACGENLDVRFDGFRKARNGFFEAFFTFKNTSESPTRNAVLDLHRGSFDVFTLGEGGAKQPHQELARAGGETATPIVTHYAILPGGEAKLRYTFNSKGDVPNPLKVGFTDRRSQTTLQWSVGVK